MFGPNRSENQFWSVFWIWVGTLEFQPQKLWVENFLINLELTRRWISLLVGLLMFIEIFG